MQTPQSLNNFYKLFLTGFILLENFQLNPVLPEHHIFKHLGKA